MGLFFPSDPIVHGQRAKGLPRYQELLERDWKSFLFADFVTQRKAEYDAGQEGGFPVLFHALAVILPPAAGRIPVAAEQRIHHAGDRRADQKPAQNADREQHQ